MELSPLEIIKAALAEVSRLRRLKVEGGKAPSGEFPITCNPVAKGTAK